MFTGTEQVSGRLTEDKVVRGMNQGIFDEQPRQTQSIDHFGQSIAGSSGKDHTPENLQRRQPVTTHMLDDGALTSGDAESDGNWNLNWKIVHVDYHS